MGHQLAPPVSIVVPVGDTVLVLDACLATRVRTTCFVAPTLANTV